MAEIEERVSSLENRMTAVETAQPFLKEMLDRSIKAQETMTDGINSMKTTLVEMNGKIDSQGKKLDELSSKVESVEEKGKIDFIGWLKDKWYWIALVLGLGIKVLSDYIKL